MIKWSSFCRSNFETHFLVWKLLDSNDTLFNSNPAVTEATFPWLTHWGEDKYGCHFSQITLLSIIYYNIYYPRRHRVMQWLKQISFCTLLYKKPLAIILQIKFSNSFSCMKNCYISIMNSHWGHGKLFAICRWNFEVNFCFVTIDVIWLDILAEAETKWPCFFLENILWIQFSCMNITVLFFFFFYQI